MRTLIVRQSAIGDCVLTIPMLGALRQAYPDSTISWLVEESSASLLRGHPWLDEVITVRKGWLKRPSELVRLARLLRGQRFDLVIDPQSLLKSALAVFLTRAKRRIGFAPPQGREQSHWFYSDRVECQTSHIVHKHLELLVPLGLEPNLSRFCFPKFPDSRQLIGRFIEGSELSGRSWYVMFAGASWPSKRWEADRFAQVARELASSRGSRAVVAWGSEEELKVAEQIVAESKGSAVLADRLSLPDLQVLTELAEFYVGADTGPMHIAAASGTDCVALFGPTRPDLCGPVGERHRVIQSFYQTGSTRERKKATNDAMRSIEASTVVDACNDILDARRSRAA